MEWDTALAGHLGCRMVCFVGLNPNPMCLPPHSPCWGRGPVLVPPIFRVFPWVEIHLFAEFVFISP